MLTPTLFNLTPKIVGTQWDDIIYGTPGRDLIVGASRK